MASGERVSVSRELTAGLDSAVTDSAVTGLNPLMSLVMASGATGRKPTGGSIPNTSEATVFLDTPTVIRPETWSWNWRNRASPSADRWSATAALQGAPETSGLVVRRLTDQLSTKVIAPASQ